MGPSSVDSRQGSLYIPPGVNCSISAQTVRRRPCFTDWRRKGHSGVARREEKDHAVCRTCARAARTGRQQYTQDWQEMSNQRGSGAYKPDRDEVRELAQHLPDPGAEDELFDLQSDPMAFGSNFDFGPDTSAPFGAGALTYADDPATAQQSDYDRELGIGSGDMFGAELAEEDIDDEEREQRARQAEYDFRARQRWEVEKAQQHAIFLHHKQVETGVNRYAQCLEIGQIMEELEAEDHQAGEDADAMPSWIRAHHVLEAQWDDFVEHQKELEEMRTKQFQQEMEADRIMLAQDVYGDRLMDEEPASKLDPMAHLLDPFLPDMGVGGGEGAIDDILGAGRHDTSSDEDDDGAPVLADYLDLDS
ncbi:hypothetical protein WJX72_003741 [[Myrmecia] bisecta]|uniref:Uncharacterized protein n=1 Tax=[Myrmecia] bisecta TaxID=41462 RepID=A0AAW1Q043_9CHLO